MDAVLEALVWIGVATLVLVVLAFFVLRPIAVRIATRVAAETERRMTTALTRGMRRSARARTPTADEALQRKHLAQIDRVARVMDRLVSLPIVGGVGLDAILGLIPVAGDVASLGASCLVIVRAAQLGAPPELLNRLVAIQCTDLLLGAVPVVGDLVDVGYRANQRSADLIHEWINSRQKLASIDSSAPSIS